MNKKFIGALLLGSLVMAGGTFTGCSDYDDDIDSLNQRVDAVEKAVEDLKAQIEAGSVITDVTSTENGVTVTLSNGKTFELKNGKDGADGTPGSIVEIGDNGNWFIDGVDTGKPSRGEKGDKGDKGDQGEQGTAGPAGGDGTSANAVYYKPGENGYWIKVTVDANGKATEEETSESWVPSNAVTVAWDTENEVLYVSNVEGYEGGVMAIQLGTKLKALVFVPSLYLDGVEGTRYPYINGFYLTADGEASGTASTGASYNIPAKNTWIDTNENYAIGAKDTVVYHMNPTSAQVNGVDFNFLYNNPEYIATRNGGEGVSIDYLANKKEGGDLKVAYEINNPNKLEGKGSDKLSVMALEAELGNDTTVTSDYASIVPAVRTLRAIAFKETGRVTTADGYDLYGTGAKAAEQEASIAVQYNKGAINLSDYLNIHYVQNDWEAGDISRAAHEVMAYEQAEKFGLHFEYEMLEYTTGTNNTEENQYGMVDKLTGEFTPCYVNDGGQSVACPGNGSTTGISAVGREPIVIVKLVNEEGQVVLAGYVKIDIVREINSTSIDIREFTKPYVCDGFEAAITWDDMSGKILETLGTTKDEFVNLYEFTAGKTYVKEVVDGKDKFVEVTDNKYGVINEGKDWETSTTNDVLEWVADFNQMEAVYNANDNHTVTLYGCYSAGTHNVVYVGITVTIADKPVVAFAEKIQQYWYPSTAALADRDTVRMNVPRPTTEGLPGNSTLNPLGDIYEYSKDLDDYFVGNEVKMTLTDAVQNQWYDLAKLSTSYHYEFADEQPMIGNYQLRGDGQYLRMGGTIIAQINPANGTLIYHHGNIPEEILNLYGHNEPLCYANVVLVGTYGDCDLVMGTEDFKVRFLRPVDILKNKNAEFIDAAANGSSVILGDLFQLQDWRDALLLQGKGSTLSSVVENGCALFDYYAFKNIKVDIKNAKCDLTGTMLPISSVTDKLQLYVEGYNANTSVTLPMTIATLTTTKITYKNNEGNVQDFNLEIPVEITYAWGTLKGTIYATVKSTIAND